MRNNQTNTLSMLNSFSINNDLDKIKKDAAESSFIFDRLVLKGQSTILFAPPNAGKTLLIINQLKQAYDTGDLNGLSVFYINADDSQSGIIEKTEILATIGVHTLVPGYNHFKSHSLLEIMNGLAADDEAKNVVLIVDTLKKFADTMDKKNMRHFGIKVSEFILKGGTFIGLGHTNKNRDTNNNLVYSGTSDLIEDVDCIYMMNIEDENTDKSGLQTKHIKLTNQKLRGNNALELTYVYEKSENMPYLDMVNSVNNIDSDTYIKEMILRTEKQNYANYISQYNDAISLISNVLSTAKIDKSKLREHLLQHTNYGRDKCIEIIDKVTGKLINFKMEGKTGRKKVYFLITNI
ncbi:helicase RepA family protein [Aliivibrio sp. 1S128]|uniref:helicase RepA family protein n=1 Tax=Aliivibrio sp. 1S128 TaxID=1840085 RepID=UPI000AD9017B|nr:helicase RepA family protein [Aliivibrio sp. 1S128]